MSRVCCTPWDGRISPSRERQTSHVTLLLTLRADIGCTLICGLHVSQNVIENKNGVIKAYGEKAIADKEKVNVLVG